MTKNPLKGVSDSDLEAIASRFRALGEVSRLHLVRALQTGEKNVTDLVEITGLSQPNASRHLAVLVAAGLLGRRKEGLNVLYRIIDEGLAEICAIVCKSVSNHSRTR
jgi:DNA-binding transcriptional ArsR family regulator